MRLKLTKRIPVWRDANLLLLEIELAVRGFPRYHKYTLGSELRLAAMRICELIARAWHERQHQRECLSRLSRIIDSLNIKLQLAKELQAYKNFAQFLRLAELAVNVGQQDHDPASGRHSRHLTSFTWSKQQ
jgi:hypothetical protein